MEPEYEVENIINKRYLNGKAQYRLKWKNYASSANTWEFAENLNCNELVTDFELQKNVMKVLSARMVDGNLMYLIKRIFEDDAIELPANKAHENCLNLVLNFLENSIMWSAPLNRSADFVAIGELIFIPDEAPIRVSYASSINRSLMYWAQWHNGGKFVSSQESKTRWPMLVVEYLENSLQFPA